MIISASEFVKGYCTRSGITEREFYETQVPMPDPTSIWGWAAVSNDPLLIKAHVDLYLSQQPEVSADNSNVIGDEGPVTFLGAHIEPHQIVTSDECRMEVAPVVPDGYVMVPKEPTEEMLQASYREASVYSPTAYRAMIAAAPQSPGSEPATVPGKWIPVSERMPEEGGRYWCYVEEQNSLGKSHYQWNCSWNGDVWSDKALTGRVTHWMPLPAAPQEVKQ